MQIVPDLRHPSPPTAATVYRHLRPNNKHLLRAEEVISDGQRQRARSDSGREEDDYYFYHKGREQDMNSRRSSIHSIGVRPREDERPVSSEPVRLPPITSLFAAVERISLLHVR
jgi:hypothetical protein